MFGWNEKKLEKEIFHARVKFCELYKNGDIVNLNKVMNDLNISKKLAINLISDLEYWNSVIHKIESKIMSIENYTYEVW